MSDTCAQYALALTLGFFRASDTGEFVRQTRVSDTTKRSATNHQLNSSLRWAARDPTVKL